MQHPHRQVVEQSAHYEARHNTRQKIKKAGADAEQQYVTSATGH